MTHEDRVPRPPMPERPNGPERRRARMAALDAASRVMPELAADSTAIDLASEMTIRLAASLYEWIMEA